jgi:hypothetical protein
LFRSTSQETLESVQQGVGDLRSIQKAKDGRLEYVIKFVCSFVYSREEKEDRSIVVTFIYVATFYLVPQSVI